MDADLIIEVGGLITPFDAYSVKEPGENVCLCFGFSSEARHVNFGRIPWGGAPPRGWIKEMRLSLEVLIALCCAWYGPLQILLIEKPLHHFDFSV
jgi:hypothetical protein